MTQKPDSFRIDLTPEQREEFRVATGKLADTVEVSITDLAQPIAPATQKD